MPPVTKKRKRKTPVWNKRKRVAVRPKSPQRAPSPLPPAQPLPDVEEFIVPKLKKKRDKNAPFPQSEPPINLHKNIIGPADLVVNRALGMIKHEDNYSPAIAVKTEADDPPCPCIFGDAGDQGLHFSAMEASSIHANDDETNYGLGEIELENGYLSPPPLLDINAASVQNDNEADDGMNVDSMILDECASNRSASPVAEINHENLETREVEKTIFTFMCRLCKEQWSTENALLYHLKDGHGLEVEPGPHPAIYKCHQCQDVFSTTVRLVKHVAGEHGLSLGIVEPYFLDISTSVKATSVNAQRDENGSNPAKRRCVSLMDGLEESDGPDSSSSAPLSHTQIDETPAFQNGTNSQDLGQQEKTFNSVFKSNNALPVLSHRSSGNRNTWWYWESPTRAMREEVKTGWRRPRKRKGRRERALARAQAQAIFTSQQPVVLKQQALHNHDHNRPFRNQTTTQPLPQPTFPQPDHNPTTTTTGPTNPQPLPQPNQQIPLPQPNHYQNPTNNYRYHNPTNNYRYHNPTNNYRYHNPTNNYRYHNPTNNYRYHNPTNNYRYHNPTNNYHLHSMFYRVPKYSHD